MLPKHTTQVRYFCRIEVGAFAAVLLAVIAGYIFFVYPELSRQMFFPMFRPGIGIDLASADAAEPKRYALRGDAMTVAVMRDGTVYFRDKKATNSEQLSQSIREAVSRGAERRVYIRTDARVRYGYVVSVLGAAQSAGVEEVTFLVEQRRRTPFLP